jgi:hypothetical protein
LNDANITVEPTTLAEHEECIKKGMLGMLAAGRSFRAIRDGKLYREYYATFDEYCHARLGFTVRRVQQIMSATEVLESLPVETRTIVRNEGMARAVGRVEPDRRDQVVHEAQKVANSEGRKPTAKDIAIVAAAKKRRPKREETEQEFSRGFANGLGLIMGSVPDKFLHVAAAQLRDAANARSGVCADAGVITVSATHANIKHAMESGSWAEEYATMAIVQLKKIQSDDPKRDEAHTMAILFLWEVSSDVVRYALAQKIQESVLK